MSGDGNDCDSLGVPYILSYQYCKVAAKALKLKLVQTMDELGNGNECPIKEKYITLFLTIIVKSAESLFFMKTLKTHLEMFAADLLVQLDVGFGGEKCFTRQSKFSSLPAKYQKQLKLRSLFKIETI